jgi:hypothetical protein
MRVMAAMWCGHYDEAARWWPEVKPDVDLSVEYWGYPISWRGEGRAQIEGELRAFTGAQKAVMAEGLQNELRGQLSEALACYKKALAASAGDAQVSAFIQERCGCLQLQQSDPQANDYSQCGPLVLSLYLHHYGVSSQMIEQGIGLNETGPMGFTPLMYAIANHQPALVQALLARGADVNASGNGDGWSALALAIQNGQSDVVQALLAKGADPNVCFWNGTPVLSLARKQGNEAIIKLLEGAGAKA